MAWNEQNYITQRISLPVYSSFKPCSDSAWAALHCIAAWKWVLDRLFLKKIEGHKSFLWGHWYICFGLLVASSLCFKAWVGSLIHAWQRHTCYMFPEIHLWCWTDSQASTPLAMLILSLHGTVRIKVILPNGNASTDAETLPEQTLSVLHLNPYSRSLFVKGLRNWTQKKQEELVGAVPADLVVF